MKVCTKCNKPRPSFFYKSEKKKVCEYCKALKNRERALRFENAEDLTLDYLTEDRVVIVFKDYIKTITTSRNDKMLETLLEIFNFKVVNKDMIYLTDYTNGKNNKVLRYEVFERDNYTCIYCGGQGETLDHFYPESLGGEWSYENLVTSCHPCNIIKSDIIFNTIEESRKYIKAMKKEIEEEKIRKEIRKNRLLEKNKINKKKVEYNKNGIPINK